MSAIPSQLRSLPLVKGVKGVKNDVHSIYPVNATGNTEFKYGGNNVVSFMVPAYSRGFLNPLRSQIHFNVKTKTGVAMADGCPVFDRMVIRSGNGQIIEDVQGYAMISRMLKNFENFTHKHANSSRFHDYRATSLLNTSALDSTQLKELYENGTTVEHDLVSGLLGKTQKYYVPTGLFNASGGFAFEIQLYLSDPKIACCKDADATVIDGDSYSLTNVEYQMEIVTMPAQITDRLDAELYNNSKVSIPISTFRLHQSYIPANSTQVELSISESAHDLECVYSCIRKQNLGTDARWADSTEFFNGVYHGDNLNTLGGHYDRTKDAAASTNAELLGAVQSYQFRYDTMLYPAKKAEMAAKDTKLALINAVHTLDAHDKDVFAATSLTNGRSLWDQGRVFAIVQSFKSSKDNIQNALNSSATGAPLELSLALKKPASEALRVEHFVKSNYTLNIVKGGQTTLINGTIKNES